LTNISAYHLWVEAAKADGQVIEVERKIINYAFNNRKKSLLLHDISKFVGSDCDNKILAKFF
jgi:hypothetical protein